MIVFFAVLVTQFYHEESSSSDFISYRVILLTVTLTATDVTTQNSNTNQSKQVDSVTAVLLHFFLSV